MRRNVFLSKHFVKQFDTKTFQDIIITFLNIIDELELLLDSDEFQISFSKNYEIKVGGNRKPTTSKVESIIFNEYDNKIKKEELLLQFRDGFNSLNEDERKVFKVLYIDGNTSAESLEQLYLYSNKLSEIKMSATVKFCLKTGLDRFVYLFK